MVPSMSRGDRGDPDRGERGGMRGETGREKLSSLLSSTAKRSSWLWLALGPSGCSLRASGTCGGAARVMNAFEKGSTLHARRGVVTSAQCNYRR